jgi:anti-sigma B factor antagonist
MPQDPLHIEDRQGNREGVRILKLSGPLVLANIFDFQAKIRADSSKGLILDFTSVQYMDSAGVGALVGAYVSRDKGERTLALVGVNQRIQDVLAVTRVKEFFKIFDSIADAETAAA